MKRLFPLNDPKDGSNLPSRLNTFSQRKDRRMAEYSPDHFTFVRQSKIPHGYFDKPSVLQRLFKWVFK